MRMEMRDFIPWLDPDRTWTLGGTVVAAWPHRNRWVVQYELDALQVLDTKVTTTRAKAEIIQRCLAEAVEVGNPDAPF